MTYPSDERRHASAPPKASVRRGARSQGVQGRPALQDAVEAVLRCQGCDHSDECALWLQRTDVATAPPPDHCTNPRLIQRLQEAHG